MSLANTTSIPAAARYCLARTPAAADSQGHCMACGQEPGRPCLRPSQSQDHSSQDQYIGARKVAKPLHVANHPDQPRIDHDRPIPVEARGGLRKYDHFYPFEQMQPGDSFWVPAESNCTAGAVTKFAAKSGWSFTSRAETQDGRPNSTVGSSKKGLRGRRVWRVS